jgi:RNA polymerase sigma factor (sigma-70 family)
VKAELLDDESDGRLIRRFAEGRDERAFAMLVERRGALVAGVCARMMRNREDAEDAVQAVFLVLARRAHSLRRDASLAGWLHAVAVRVCLAQRAANLRTQRRVQEAAEVAQEAHRPDQLAELKLVIDEELAALPQRLREVLVLCDLEGRTREEVARALSLPVGTVSSRLARGRDRMRKRLVRQGLPVAAGGFVSAISTLGQAAPAITAGLVQTTVRNAHVFAFGTAAAKATLGIKITALAEGVLYAMIVKKWKIAASLAVLMAIILGGGTAVPGLTNTAFGGPFFLDDFEDGSVTDGAPVTWTVDPQLNGGTHVVQDGSYVLTPDTIDDYPNANISEIDVIPGEASFSQVSLRSVVRLLGPQNEFIIGLAGRSTRDEAGKQNTALFGVVRPSGELRIGAYNVQQNKDERWMGTYPFTSSLETRDLNLQLDIFADSAALTAWEVGTPRPPTPQIFIADLPDYLPSKGGIAMWTAQVLTSPVVPVAFRYFEAAPVPEPSVAFLSGAAAGLFAFPLLFARRRLGQTMRNA